MASKSILAMQLGGMTPEEVREHREARERLAADARRSQEARVSSTTAKHGPLPGSGGRPRKKAGPPPGTFTAAMARALDKGRATIEAKRRERFGRIVRLVQEGYCGRALLFQELGSEDYPLRTFNRDLADLEALGVVHIWKREYVIPAFYHNSPAELYKLKHPK